MKRARTSEEEESDGPGDMDTKRHVSFSFEQRQDLLPELWAEIRGYVTAVGKEDAIARARARIVCKAWLALDPDFVAPMHPHLLHTVRVGRMDPEFKAIFSWVLARLIVALGKDPVRVLHRVNVWTKQHMAMILYNPTNNSRLQISIPSASCYELTPWTYVQGRVFDSASFDADLDTAMANYQHDLSTYRYRHEPGRLTIPPAFIVTAGTKA